MTMQQKDWPAGRVVHLAGGCRAVHDPGPLVHLVPDTIDGKTAQFQMSTYGDIHNDLESLGLRTVGVDFYSHILEVEGSVPPNWRPFHRTETTLWPVAEVSQKWRNIGHEAFQKKNGELWDIGSRIGHQLRVCSWRLRETSEGYHNQLCAQVREKDFRVGKRFKDGFTMLTYLSLQSFLVDACILRDYLSEFAAKFVYARRIDLDKEKITTMGSLKKKVLNRISHSDALTKMLRMETNTNGWIKLLGDYRDLVVHSAPLAHAERALFSICDEFRINEKGSLPAIRCPIPENPAQISQYRSRDDRFRDFKAKIDAFIKASRGDVSSMDGMEYAHATLGNLSRLAELLAQESPVEPKMIALDSSDLIGPVKVIDIRR